MKPAIFILLFLCMTACCAGQTSQPVCGAFKSGEFAYRDSALRLINVSRRGSHQEEVDKKNKIITKFKIKWVSECEYELTQVWSNSKAKRKQNRTVTRVIITKSNGNDSYEYTCACRDREEKRNGGTMVRLSN